MKNVFIYISCSILMLGASPAVAEAQLTSPDAGVLCDMYICADRNGVSVDLTGKHLGKAAAKAVRSQGDFDVTEFTYANGVFCDTKERACHIDRYFGANGERSKIEPGSTARLFGG